MARWILAVLAFGGLSASFVVLSAEPPSQDWPCWRGPTHDGRSPLKGVRKDWTGGLRKIWDTAELCQGDLTVNASMSSPVVASGMVIVMGRGTDKDLLFAFDAETGKRRWMKDYPAKAEKPWPGIGNGARATPFVEADCVYTLGAYGHLGCWELKTGSPKWLVNARDESKTTPNFWGVCGSPAVYGRNVLVKVGGYDQGPNAPLVMAYDKATGKIAWKSSHAVGSWAPLVVLPLDGKDVLLAWHSRGLKGLDPTNGQELWDIPWKTPYDCHGSAPAAEGSCLFMTSGYRVGCRAFEIKGDRPNALWPVNKAVASCCSDPVIHDGFVYSFSGNGPDGELKCLELRSGAQKWETRELGNGSLLFVDGCLLCLSYKGVLALVEARPDAFKKLAHMKMFDANDTQPAYASPAVAGKHVLLRYREALRCYALAE